jgi:hypothetical protein
MRKNDFLGTYFFSASKSEKKLPEIWARKRISKMNISRNKVAESFFLDCSSTIPSLDYDRKWVRGSVSAVPWCYFSRFLLRLLSIFVWWHGHNLTIGDCGTSKAGLIDSEGPSYSTKAPSDLFLRYGIMLKKNWRSEGKWQPTADSRPCCTRSAVRWISASQEKPATATQGELKGDPAVYSLTRTVQIGAWCVCV